MLSAHMSSVMTVLSLQMACLQWNSPRDLLQNWVQPLPSTLLCVQELDKQRGRGQQGAKSPLLWDDDQVAEYFAGSPIIKDVATRLKVPLHRSTV